MLQQLERNKVEPKLFSPEKLKGLCSWRKPPFPLHSSQTEVKVIANKVSM